MANDTIRYNIRPYKNIIPCGGYKMLGGGVIGDSVIPGYVDAVLSEKAPMLDPMLFGVVDEQAKIIEEERPDIIHIHFVTNALMLRLALRKIEIPRLFQVPGPLHLENRFFRKIEIKTSNKFDY